MAAVESSAGTRAVTARGVTLLPELLDGGEVVILAIKPSLWFLLFDSARWLVVGGCFVLFAMLSATGLAGLSARSIAQLGLMMMAVRVALALLRWASRFYVLTNRRVMRLCGVLRADLTSCPLVEIRNTRVTRALHEQITRLGTIEFYFERQPPSDLNWRQVARPDAVHAEVRKAIERAIDNQPHA